MAIDINEIKSCLETTNQKTLPLVATLTEEELRSLFLETKILNKLGYFEIGKDIRLELTIPGKGKRPDIQCLDDYGNTIFVIEFKKSSKSLF